MKKLTPYKSLLATSLFLAVATAWAGPQITIPEIVRALDADSFWTNRPITVRFTQTVEMYANAGPATATNFSIYNGEGILTTKGFIAESLLAPSRIAKIADAVPLRKFFIQSNDYTMSYFLLRTNTAGQAGSQKKGADLGEAIVGVPACNCTEKFWSFPITPSVLARKLEALEEPACNMTNINGEDFVLVTGKSEDEKAGMIWHILLKKTRLTWLPVRSDIFFQDQLLSTIEAFFNAGDAYSLNKIKLTLFRANRIIGRFDWTDIKAVLGDESSGKFVGMDIIPSGLLVTDYRLKKPIIYVMAESKTAVGSRKMIRMDTPPADKQKEPENTVRVFFVRCAFFFIVFSPPGWILVKKLRDRWIFNPSHS